MGKQILCNIEMTRAVLGGRKTQTRRVIKPSDMKLFEAAASIGECSGFMHNGVLHPNDLSYLRIHCPYGKNGDVFHIAGLPYSITSVGVERIQDISEYDACWEGIDPHEEMAPIMSCDGEWMGDEPRHDYRGPFSCLWDSIYKDKGLGWDVNPWVWVIKFKAGKGI